MGGSIAGTLAAVFGIALVDIVLSGDNALVIGAAASRLPRSRQTAAIAIGGICAILFRVALAVIATELLRVALLRAIGGIVLVVIALRLLLQRDEVEAGPMRVGGGLLSAVGIIVLADATMSLDNVLAVGALADGNVILVAGGLFFSMIVLFVASAVVARLIGRFAWLLDLAAVVLAWTAGTLIAEDAFVRGYLDPAAVWELAIRLALVDLVLVVAVALRWRTSRTKPARSAASPSGYAEPVGVAAERDDRAAPTA